jgi:hypothetical protein
MATERQLAANRKNALRSKGPSSRAGIARTARNAQRHGLAATPQPVVLQQIKQLALEIAGDAASALRREKAREVAHAAIDLARVREVRIAILNRALGEQNGSAWPTGLRRVIPELLKLDRYESRALARRNRALRDLTRDQAYRPGRTKILQNEPNFLV